LISEYSHVLAVLNWIKSRCSLELRYGNLTLFRLAEVKDNYFSDPTITHVSIFKGKTFRKRHNQGFCGILLEVMDIYPVIKHAEQNFLECIASSNIKSSKQQSHYDKISVDYFSPFLPTTNQPTTLNNIGTTTVDVHHTIEAQNDNKNKPSDSDKLCDKPSDNDKPCDNYKPSDNYKPTNEALYPKRRLKNHKYDRIGETGVKEPNDHSIYEILDLAAFKSHRSSLMASFDSQVVDALALDKQLRCPSINSLSSACTYKRGSSRSSSEVFNTIRAPLRSSFSTDSSGNSNFRLQRAKSGNQSGSQTAASSFKSNDLLTTSYRSQRSLSTFASRSR